MNDRERDFQNTTELLDKPTGIWTAITSPEDSVAPYLPEGAFWDGERFLFTSIGRDWDADEGLIVATAFDPGTMEWTELASLNTGAWRTAEEAVNGNYDSAFSQHHGMMVWGIHGDESGVVGGVFVDNEWTKITATGAPSPRRYHDIVAADDGFYVVGGIHVDSGVTWEVYGEVWH